MATFNPNGLEGLWSVADYDIETSDAIFTDFFRVKGLAGAKQASTKVTYKIMNYDILGPEDFHKDRSMDKSYNEDV